MQSPFQEINVKDFDFSKLSFEKFDSKYNIIYDGKYGFMLLMTVYMNCAGDICYEKEYEEFEKYFKQHYKEISGNDCSFTSDYDFDKVAMVLYNVKLVIDYISV